MMITGNEVSNRSERWILFFQSKEKVYFLTAEGKVISLSLRSQASHEMNVYHNAVKIEGKRVSLNKIVALAWLGFISGSFRFQKTGAGYSMRKIRIQIDTKECLIAVYGSKRFATFIRFHERKEKETWM